MKQVMWVIIGAVSLLVAQATNKETGYEFAHAAACLTAAWAAIELISAGVRELRRR